MYTKEQIFAAFAFNMALADGSLDESEVKKIYSVASANELNADAVIEACRKEINSPSDLVEMAKQMTEADKDLILFGVIRISLADGKISVKEMQRVHALCELFGWGPQYATIKYVQQLKQEPTLQVEGVDF